MNRKVWTIVAAVVFALGVTGIAQQQAPAAKETTITGEVIDVKCGQGIGHEECATQCARKGLPAAIKNKEGVYTIIGAYAADKNEKLMPFVAKNVTAKGTVAKDKDGKLTIDVTSITPAK
ncbi:MAG TPA: hypothetical protein VES67_23900 [Vicinamibacterales bacterium]|nr:hypothetical protein [Vicinamibacterales bacterium]